MTKFQLTIFLLLSALFTACFTTRPLVDPMKLALNGRHSLQEIDSSLRRAASDRGWVLKAAGENAYLAKLQVRSHIAVVKITYDQNMMTVRYVKSDDLDYDGENIHKKYHMWVDRLFASVKQRLAGKSPKE